MSRHRQRITLHDLTALRVDQSGERVQSSLARSRKQASSAKVDLRGNVVAARPFIRKTCKHQLDSGDEQLELVGESLNAEEGRPRKKQKRKHYLPEFLPFLHPSRPRHSTDKSEKELPSSDLLKVVHHFASCYYDERGMLTASARAARAERRSKAKSRSNPIDSSAVNDLEEDRTPESETMDDDISRSMVGRTSIPHKIHASRALRNVNTSPDSPNEYVTSPENRIKDMHRAFDGSTLLLIGMILQSHIESLVTRPPPSASVWEDQINDDRMRIQKKSQMRRKRTRYIKEKVEVEDGVKAEPSVDSQESDDNSNFDSEGETGGEEGDTKSIGEETGDGRSGVGQSGSKDDGTDNEKESV